MTNNSLAGARILITGGTGSFGRVMTKHALSRDVDKVVIFSRDEAKQHDMRVEFADPRISFHVGDVRDQRSVDRAMAGIDLVFHAAALKQVPTAEFFPLQAMWTNIVGSANVVEAAEGHNVAAVVCLSTDKAVMPVNAMGMTKALMEKVARAAARANQSDTVVSVTRYGNVIFSRGSVVPLFVNQILEGKAMTVTDPEMTRFLMPLQSAVSLVEFALTNAEGGEIFVRKSPAVTIGTLAEATAQLFDVEPKVDIIGVRHGEKMHETLATARELAHADDMGDYYRLTMDDRDLNYGLYFVEGDEPSESLEDYTSFNSERLDVQQTTELLLTLPEIQDVLARWRAD